MRQTFAAELRAEMARQRKTGLELAAVLGISQQSASRRMNGEVDVSLDEIAAITEWLGVSFSDLLRTNEGVA